MGFGEDAFTGSSIYADLAVAEYRDRMQNVAFPENFFGLTYGAHTREAYLLLQEGWTTTPRGISTDLYMWRKFLARFPLGCCTGKKVTALNFSASLRREWSEQKQKDVKAFYFNKILEPEFIKKVNEIVLQTLSAQAAEEKKQSVPAWIAAEIMEKVRDLQVEELTEQLRSLINLYKR